MATPKEQLLSRTVYDTNGTTTIWDFAFSGGYLDPAHVKAYTENTLGVRTALAINPATDLVGQFQLRIQPALAAGLELVIYRDTPKNLPLVDFTDESGFSEIALDTNAKQGVFIAAEAIDTVNALDVAAAIDAAERAGIAATSAQASQTASASSANAAANSATAADGSATRAATSATEAANSAASVNPANFVQVTGNQTIGGVKTFTSSLVLGRTDLATEGGQIEFQRASDGLAHYALDVLGAGTAPNFRLINIAKGVAAWTVDDNHNFTATGNITAGGTVNATSFNGGQLAGMRNKIINGKMEIAQRGTSFAAIASGAYSLDRWKYLNASTAVVTASQQFDVPSNEFQNSLRVAVTTADTSIAAGDFSFLMQVVEGYNARDLIGRTFTVSFWARSSKTGTHCVALSNSGNDRSYVAEYAINTANTWEFKSITVSGGLTTAGTWGWVNGIGVETRFALAAGPSFQTTAGAWQTGNFLATANQVNCLDTIGNIFAITGVQLEVGSVATPFEHRPYGAELALCQRYFEVAAWVVTTDGASGAYQNLGAWKVTKRAEPTVTTASQTGGSFAAVGDFGFRQDTNPSAFSGCHVTGSVEL